VYAQVSLETVDQREFKISDKENFLTDFFFTNVSCSQYLDLYFLIFIIIGCAKVNKKPETAEDILKMLQDRAENFHGSPLWI